MTLRRLCPALPMCLYMSIGLLLLCLSAANLRAQGGSATVTGLITDPHEKVIVGADVQAVNIGTNVTYPTKTNGDGIYSIPNLPPGEYRIHVRRDGFKEVNMTDLTLHTQDDLEQNFQLEVGSTEESVTVTAGATNESPAVSLTVDREFVENMPLNGQSFQDLIQLAPGIVDAVNSSNSGSGYYTIDGQRTDSNNYMIDGVSANLGGLENESSSQGGALSGNTPMQTASGTTQGIASIDALQEFTIQTSGYTAEFGRNPGGQVEFTTRSGTNAIHGTLFDYLRNTAFDANSFWNDFHSDPQTAEHQNDFGGTVGGPLIVPRLYNGKDKTFYFFSYEGLRLLLPDFESEYVPTQAFIAAASTYIQPYLSALPLPNPSSPGNNDGCTTTGVAGGPACDALFSYGYSNPENIDNISVRVDHSLSQRLHLFARYANTPTYAVGGNAESPTSTIINTHLWTAGLDANLTHQLVNTLRFNFTHDGEQFTESSAAVGGSVPLARNLLIPSAYDDPFAYGTYLLRLSGSSLNKTVQEGASVTIQHQYQAIDSIEWTKSKHTFKFGADWRRLTPIAGNDPYFAFIETLSRTLIQAGTATEVYTKTISSGKPVFDNLSLYAQDHWRATPALTVDYGLRWELNPAPGPANGEYPVALTSNNLATAVLAPLGTQPYQTYYDKFAPRVGFAWNIWPAMKRAVTLRGGFGIFYDTGQSVIGNAYSGAYPYSKMSPIQTNVPFPLSNTVLAPPTVTASLTAPYASFVSDLSTPDLTLPYTEQWNLSLDYGLNEKNRLTVSYVGNNGRKLLFTQYYGDDPAGNTNFPDGLSITSNAAQSSYNALQVQDVGRITAGLNVVGSFTLAHALDNASNDLSDIAPIWGNSDNDIRRVFNIALNYDVPTVHRGEIVQSLTHGWLLANRFATQSGYPVNVYEESNASLPNGAEIDYTPNLVPGVPIYLHGSAAYSSSNNISTTPPYNIGWALNRAAFACTGESAPLATSGACTVSPTAEGTLGRNYLRNPAFWALNTAVQRSFPIYEQLQLKFRADAFNIFNHPNLSNPYTASLGSTFGELDGITTIGASKALYAMGASRSLQFSLKLQF